MNLPGEDKATFHRRIAETIILTMTETKTSFTELSKLIDVPVDKLRDVIYSNDNDITIGQIMKIMNAMDQVVKLFYNQEDPPNKLNRHLKLVE